MRRALAPVLAACALLSAVPAAAQPDNDPILRAMAEEIERAKTLQLPRLEAPYFVEYALDEATNFSVTATLGAIVSEGNDPLRAPRIQIRVGSAEFDNTNYVFSDFFGGRAGRMPLDDDVTALRRHLWLASDRAYKGALESIARKRAALRDRTVQESLPDLAPAQPTRLIEPRSAFHADEALWRNRVRALSAIFSRYSEVLSSQVELQASAGAAYLVNSEGTRVRVADDLIFIRVRASGQAPDGMPLRDAVTFQARSVAAMPPEAVMRAETEQLARNLALLEKAPVAEDYAGPVLVEDVAAPQLFTLLLGGQLGLPRRPAGEVGRPLPFGGSELEGRKGSRLLPEWIDAVDDPLQDRYRGRELFGSYRVDIEGTIPVPLKVVERGTLAQYLLTRQPVRGFTGSNGRARLPGPYGAKMAAISNLFLRASETVPHAEMKGRLLALLEQRDKPYGLLIRKLDFPATSTLEEIRKLAEAAGQRGSGRAISSPILAYRVYRDGREELVRGLRFRGVSSRSLRDIIAASDQENVFDYLNNGTPLAQMGAGSYVVGSSVVAPAVLFEDLELERRTEDWPKPPLVPPPALTAQR